MAMRLESVRSSHVLGMDVVELEHRHRFLIGQCRVRAAEAFELRVIETAQTIIERFVFGIRARSERYPTLWSLDLCCNATYQDA